MEHRSKQFLIQLKTNKQKTQTNIEMYSNPDFNAQELYNLQRSLRFHLLLPKITARVCSLAMEDTSLAGVPGQLQWDPPSNKGTNPGCKTHHFSS